MVINLILMVINSINKENEKISDIKNKYLNDIIQKDFIISLKINEIEKANAKNNELIEENMNLKNDNEKMKNILEIYQNNKNNKERLFIEQNNLQRKVQIKKKEVNFLKK